MDNLKRYDRQLRLWNEEGQQMLFSSTVILYNLSITNIEILKGLVLGGVYNIVYSGVEAEALKEIARQATFYIENNNFESVEHFYSLFENTLKRINPLVCLKPLKVLNLTGIDTYLVEK
jgi:molybdopterin/thiamine biosynthesis adenylyltransferase